MRPTQRFLFESGLLVVGFTLVAVVLVALDSDAGSLVPVIVLLGLACWVFTILVPWLRARRAERAQKAAEER